MHGSTARLLAAALMAAGLAGTTNAGAQTVPIDERQRAQRYQIGVMERILEQAVEHGASIARERLRAVLPAEMLLSESAEARGFRLQNYGLFFDVVVPNLEGTLPWVFQTLDRNDLGLERALAALRAMVEQAGDAELQQALRRVELQVAPLVDPAGGRDSGLAPASSRSGEPATSPGRGNDPSSANPQETYRHEVISALMDAMLDHARGLDLGPEEWLTVGARRSEAPRVGLNSAPASTIQIGLRGADLQAFLQGSITREDARRRMDVRVF